MRLQHKEAQHLRIGDLQHVAQQLEVAQRLAHLLGVDLQHAAVHPVVRERAAARGLALRALVLVVREHEVGAAAVDVEGKPQVLARHGRALDVPAGTAHAPGRLPRRLAGLGGLPQREVQRVALAILHALAVGAQLAVAALHLVYVAARQLAVSRERTHVEVHVAVGVVSVAAVDELLDELYHCGDLLGSLRTDIGIQHAGRAHVLDERLGVLGGHLGSAAAFLKRLADDLVVHVGDVLHERHVEAAPHKVTADHVEADERAGVADVNVVVHGRSAHVHAHLAALERLEVDLRAGLRIVESDHGVLASCLALAPRSRDDEFRP